jgi:hypothetical protein
VVEQAEDHLAEQVGAAPGDVLLDFPSKPAMLSMELPVATRSGAMARLGETGMSERVGIHRVASELHTSARRLRVFTAYPIAIDPAMAVAVITLPARELADTLEMDGVGRRPTR